MSCDVSVCILRMGCMAKAYNAEMTKGHAVVIASVLIQFSYRLLHVTIATRCSQSSANVTSSFRLLSPVTQCLCESVPKKETEV